MERGNSIPNRNKAIVKSKPPRPSTVSSPTVGSNPTGRNNLANATPRRGAQPPPPPPSSAMPVTNVLRVMRKVLPPDAKITQETKETMQECLTEFISFISTEANYRCNKEYRKTIRSEDLIESLRTLGFDNYAEILTRYLQRYREAEGLPNSRQSQPRSDQTALAPPDGLGPRNPSFHKSPVGRGVSLMPQPAVMPQFGPHPAGQGGLIQNEAPLRPNASLMPQPGVIPSMTQFGPDHAMPFATNTVPLSNISQEPRHLYYPSSINRPKFGEGSSSTPVSNNTGFDGVWNYNNYDELQYDALEQMLAAVSPSSSSAGSTSWAAADHNNSGDAFHPLK